MSKVSVIVPVYNAEKYLKRCLDALRQQTFSDIEIICINDGSTDDSQKILDEYIARDKRFIVINKKNSGVSAARNDGIKRACGEYIHFMDADDFIDSDYYERMVDMAQNTGADMVCSGLLTNTKYARDIKYKSCFTVRGIYNKLRRTYALTDGYVWRYLFKTEFIRKNKLVFNTKMISQEDVVFVLNAIALSELVAFVSDTFYHYMFNEASALNNRDAEHHKKMKEQYRQGKQFRRDFARAHGVKRLWYLRKILRNF